MSARSQVESVAAGYEWTQLTDDGYRAEYERTLLFPGTKVQRFADTMGWQLKERLVIRYSVDGRAISAYHSTPSHQAATDGRFVGSIELGAPRRESILNALMSRWTPSE